MLDSISDSPSASVEELSMFIRFEREPRETFRGRTDGELKPLSSITEDGQPIEARAPTYVLDSKKRRLTLLVDYFLFFKITLLNVFFSSLIDFRKMFSFSID